MLNTQYMPKPYIFGILCTDRTTSIIIGQRFCIALNSISHHLATANIYHELDYVAAARRSLRNCSTLESSACAEMIICSRAA